MGKVASQRRAADGGASSKAKEQYKQLMFIGTPLLLVLVIGLLVWKAPWQDGPPRPKAQVIDDTLPLQEADAMAKSAAKKYGEAMKITDDGARYKMLVEAISLNRQALDKLAALSQSERYSADGFDGVFEPRINKLQQEFKIYGDAKARCKHD